MFCNLFICNFGICLNHQFINNFYVTNGNCALEAISDTLFTCLSCVNTPCMSTTLHCIKKTKTEENVLKICITNSRPWLHVYLGKSALQILPIVLARLCVSFLRKRSQVGKILKKLIYLESIISCRMAQVPFLYSDLTIFKVKLLLFVLQISCKWWDIEERLPLPLYRKSCICHRMETL